MTLEISYLVTIFVFGLLLIITILFGFGKSNRERETECVNGTSFAEYQNDYLERLNINTRKGSGTFDYVKDRPWLSRSLYNQLALPGSPQLMIILIDQSSSMSEIFFSEEGKDYSFARVAKNAVDSFLYEILSGCISGNEIRPFVDLAIIGYGASIRSATPKIPMDQLPFSVAELQTTFIKKNEADDGDVGYHAPLRYEWIEEISDGATSMLAALEKAKEITEKWITTHQDSFPPVILNITDGMATDDPILIERVQRYSLGDLSALPLVTIVKEIQKLSTNDGNVLVCNAQLSGENQNTLGGITYPTNVRNTDDPYTKLLFEMSSVIPDTLLEEFIETYEEIRHLKNFDPNHCPIMEFMTIGNKNYFLQYHKTRDFEPSTFVLDRPRKKGEKPTWFVRGATSPEGMTVKTTIQYSALWTELSNIPNPQDEEGSFDFHYKNVFSDIMSRRRKLQIEVERHNLKSAFIKGIDRGHLPAAKLFKPEVSIIMNERYRSYQRSEVKNWSNNLKNKFPHHSGKDEILNQPNFTIDLHVISDGRKAYISRV